MRAFSSLFFVLSLFVVVGCASSETKYGDAGGGQLVDLSFGSQDLQQIAKAIVDDLHKEFAPPSSKNGKPTIAMRKFKNDTQEHLNTKDIAAKIRNAVIRNRKFKITAEREDQMDLLEEIELQNDSGLYKDAVVKGQWIAPEYLLTARISSIVKKNDDLTDVYYLFTMKLTEVETGQDVFASEKELRKQKVRATFGS